MSFGTFAFGGAPIASEILRERVYRGHRVYRGRKVTMRAGTKSTVVKPGSSLTKNSSSTILKT